MKILLILIALADLTVRTDKVVINKEFEINNTANTTIIIDNLNGDVKVEASADNTLYLELEIHISASSEKLLAAAKKELELGQQRSSDSLIFYTKAPFVQRCNWKNSWGYNNTSQPAYDFRYQYTVRVPKNVTLEAKTINKGDVFIEQMEGPVKACNVNGKVRIEGARKVLQASTVNGDVDIQFLEALQTQSSSTRSMGTSISNFQMTSMRRCISVPCMVSCILHLITSQCSPKSPTLKSMETSKSDLLQVFKSVQAVLNYPLKR